MVPTDLGDLERQAYQESLSDGLIDLFIGLSLASIGVVWLWIEWLPGLAGIVQPILVWALLRIRHRVVEPRLGYVAWRAPRLRWERRHVILFAALLLAAFLVGNGVMYAIREGETFRTQGIAPGLPASVLAIGAFGVAARTRIRRLWAYGVVLAGAAVVTILADANPGGSLLVSGALICVVGGVLLARFLRTNPVRDAG